MMLIKTQCRKQKGFSLLEALLAIVIIVAAGLGVVELFISADNKNKLQTTEQMIQQTASAASQYLSTTYNPDDELSATNLIASGFISKNYIVGSGSLAKITGPYGALEVSSNSSARDQYYITFEDTLPAEQAMRLCQDMYTSSAVYTGSSDSGTLVTSLTGCQTNFSGSGRSQITFAFPKDSYVSY